MLTHGTSNESSLGGTVRIALVVPEYRTGPNSGGGVASHAQFLIQALTSNTSWSVEIISPRMWSRAPESRRILKPSSWFRKLAIRIRDVDGTRVTDVGSTWAEIEPFRYRPRRVLDDLINSYDLAVVESGTPAMAMALRRVQVPVILQVATFFDAERDRVVQRSAGWRRSIRFIYAPILRRFDRIGVRLPVAVLVDNDWMVERCRNEGARQVTLCPPGVDTSRFRAAEGSVVDGYLFSVSRLSDPRKQVGVLIQAYALARSKFGVRNNLVLAGRTPPRAADLKLIVNLGLEDVVQIISPVSSELLPELYRGAALFVLASQEEGFGIVMIESLASGVPIVATATEGARQVIADAPVGSLVELGPDLIPELAEAIAAWANDPGRRGKASAAARTRAVHKFSSDAAEGLVREVVSGVQKLVNVAVDQQEGE